VAVPLLTAGTSVLVDVSCESELSVLVTGVSAVSVGATSSALVAEAGRLSVLVGLSVLMGLSVLVGLSVLMGLSMLVGLSVLVGSSLVVVVSSPAGRGTTDTVDVSVVSGSPLDMGAAVGAVEDSGVVTALSGVAEATGVVVVVVPGRRPPSLKGTSAEVVLDVVDVSDCGRAVGPAVVEVVRVVGVDSGTDGEVSEVVVVGLVVESVVLVVIVVSPVSVPGTTSVRVSLHLI